MSTITEIDAQHLIQGIEDLREVIAETRGVLEAGLQDLERQLEQFAALDREELALLRGGRTR